MIKIWLVTLVGLVLLGAIAGGYNRLVRLRNKVVTAWAGIDVQLARRADLVPNLVETVRGASQHERETPAAVGRPRGAAGGPRPGPAGQADDQLEEALGRLWAVAEAYPRLQTSQNYLQLQTELSTLEEDISFARRYHNGSVEQFNTAQQRFPLLLVARSFSFRPAEFFKAGAVAQAVPGVDLS